MNRVMLATDGSLTAAKATATAIDLARLLDAELVVVSVWQIPYTTVGLAPMAVTAEYATSTEEETKTIAADAAARAEEAGVETRTLVLRGMPVPEICGAAERFAPQYLVVGSHGRGALKRAVFGSVSMGVLHHAKCPVLVVPAETRERATTARVHDLTHA